MTDPQRRSQHEIIADLRRYGDQAKLFEEDLQIAREDLGRVLLEGFSERVELTWTAYKLRHKAQREATHWEMVDKMERMEELGRMESRDEHEELDRFLSE